MIPVAQDPFGTFRLTSYQQFLLGLADFMPDNKLGRWMISLLRKIALLGKSGPFDVERDTHMRLRLYPFSNRCEKRMIAGPHVWDAQERKALSQAVKMQDQDESFVFFDVGANVGLYALTCWQVAQKHNKKCVIFAIEPDETNLQRLQFNTQASGAGITCIQTAIGGHSGIGLVKQHEHNRGQIRVEEKLVGKKSHLQLYDKEINIKPLAEIINDHNITCIDAMKMDIEGRDYGALDAFFSHTPLSLWPKLLIVECGKGASDVLDLCLDKGYVLVQRTKINAILEFLNTAEHER